MPATPTPDELDIAIIGAGAAGIAAARLCQAEGYSCQIFEARDRVGGRAHTLNFRGQPLDMGAHWMHMAGANPLIPLGEALGIEMIKAPDAYPYYVAGKLQSLAETACLREAWAETEARALANATAQADISVAECLPDLGEWSDSIAFNHGLYCGRGVEEISAFDYARVEDADNRFPRGGYGAMLEKLAYNLPICLNTEINQVEWSGGGIRLSWQGRTIEARKLIITVPVPVLATLALRFSPALPTAHRKAIQSFKPAAYDHVLIHWPNSPFDAGNDQLTLFKGGRRRNISVLAHIEGSDFHYVEIGGALMIDFVGSSEERKAFASRAALGELQRHFGQKATSNIEIIAVTNWWNDPFSRGSWSITPPGKALAREALQEGIDQKIWFAGEACSPSQWGTVGGAWLEGERAAKAALISFKS